MDRNPVRAAVDLVSAQCCDDLNRAVHSIQARMRDGLPSCLSGHLSQTEDDAVPARPTEHTPPKTPRNSVPKPPRAARPKPPKTVFNTHRTAVFGTQVPEVRSLSSTNKIKEILDLWLLE